VALSPGTRLGPYEVTAQIGVGGMGEVYRATDTNLKRAVAIKVLPESVAADAGRLARFQREAEVLASLNHSHIAAIYGLERSDGTTALVMELVEGPTLADRIAQGPIPVDETLPIAKQIAEALEAAHEQGIIHRDLKPANIKVRPDGTVKVLDFGLAKAMDPPASSPGVSQSPTITTPAMTQAGMVLGTAAYMSPEQAKGRTADKRSDVWAFGAVLFEMLTGARTFEGGNVADTLANVLKVEPNWASLPSGLSPTLLVYIKRSLHKDPRQRVPDIGAMRLALEGAFETPGRVPAPTPGKSGLKGMVLAAALAAAATAALTWMLTRAEPGQVTRFGHQLRAEAFTRIGRPSVAISRDGRRMVYVANDQLYLRNLHEVEARPISGTTENPSSPVFSPDGEWVGFWSSDGNLKKILVGGSTPITLTATENPYGVSWDLDDTIVYGQADGIWRVSASGGGPDRLVTAADGERVHGPQLLPGGAAVLFAVTTAAGSTAWDDGDIVVQTLDTGERAVVRSGGAHPRYVPTGHLVFVRQNTLFALPFDLKARAVRGGPQPVVRGVMRAPTSDIGIAQYAFSDTGTLAYIPYVPGDPRAFPYELAFFDRSGTMRRLSGSAGAFAGAQLSPDDTRVVVSRLTDGQPNVWIYEIAAAQWRQLTFDGGRQPVWTPNGRAITFLRDRALWQVAADFSGAAEALVGTAVPGNIGPLTWSPDGTVLLYGSQAGLHAFRAGRPSEGLAGDGRGSLVLPRPEGIDAVAGARFSPDGQWPTRLSSVICRMSTSAPILSGLAAIEK
jgi:hypothetical protein